MSDTTDSADELSCPVCGSDMATSVGSEYAVAICLGRRCLLVIKQDLRYLEPGQERKRMIEMIRGFA